MRPVSVPSTVGRAHRSTSILWHRRQLSPLLLSMSMNIVNELLSLARQLTFAAVTRLNSTTSTSHQPCSALRLHSQLNHDAAPAEQDTLPSDCGRPECPAGRSAVRLYFAPSSKTAVAERCSARQYVVICCSGLTSDSGGDTYVSGGARTDCHWQPGRTIVLRWHTRQRLQPTVWYIGDWHAGRGSAEVLFNLRHECCALGLRYSLARCPTM